MRKFYLVFRQIQYYRSMNFISFPIEEYNYHKPMDLNKALKIGNKLGRNNRDALTLSFCRKCGFFFFIIISFFVIIIGSASGSTGISIIIIIILYGLAQLNQYTNEPMQTMLKNRKLIEQKIKDIFTQRVKQMDEILMTSKEDLKFQIKNSIDITGYVDLTKPPPYYFQEIKHGSIFKEQYSKIKNTDTNVSNLVSIHFGFEKYYIIDKESENFMIKYLKKCFEAFRYKL